MVLTGEFLTLFHVFSRFAASLVSAENCPEPSYGEEKNDLNMDYVTIKPVIW